MKGAEASALVVTVLRLLKVMVVKPAGVTVRVTFLEPSVPSLCSITDACVTTLTAHEEPAPKVKATLALRATTSARAFCNPFVIDSAALRICALRAHAWKLGTATAARTPMIATPIINSTSENPEGLVVGKAFNTHPLYS